MFKRFAFVLNRGLDVREVYRAVHTSFIFHCTGHHLNDVPSLDESRLSDAGITYVNVCNVIEYSSNKYFASWRYSFITHACQFDN